MSRVALLTSFVIATAAASSATAGVTWSSTGSNNRAASALFEVSGSSLVIRLSNDSAADANVPTDMLTGVFFNISGGAVALTRTSVVLAAGATVINGGGTDAGGVVGGEWAYKSGISLGGSTYGVSSSGLGLFGPGDLFPGSNLDGPSSPNGVEYGITSASDPGTNNNGGATTPLIRNAIVITLGNVGANFDLSRIGNVLFQYGTDVSEPRDTSTLVPTPGASALIGLGALAVTRRRRA